MFSVRNTNKFSYYRNTNVVNLLNEHKINKKDRWKDRVDKLIKKMKKDSISGREN